MIPKLEQILDKSGIHPLRAKACYVFGSRVYGNHKNESDWDIKLIANGTMSNVELRRGLYNIHIITPQDFEQQLKEHKPGSVECVLGPDKFRIKDGDFPFKLSIPSLRHSFSHTSSNSWVKAKKKIEKGDYEVGVKSLFHSMRIPMLGTQIAEHGKIIDWTVANDIHKKLWSRYDWTWEELDEEFREQKNNILTEFRKVTTK
jgi:hypothetical protein